MYIIDLRWSFQVLQHCFDAGINISASVCDMDGVNKRALSILGASVEKPYILLNNREVVTIFDTPHLLKCFRNMFLKYDIKCRTNIKSNDQIGFGKIFCFIRITILYIFSISWQFRFIFLQVLLNGAI